MKTQRENVMEPETFPQTVQNLAEFLGDTYVLYVKTQNFHWNLIDPRFFFLHKMLEEQYEDLAETTDVIAERMRALGSKALGSMKEFLENSSLKEAPGEYSADEMLRQLANDHETIARGLHARIETANKEHDDGSADLFIQRLRVHDKTAWMLRSHFKNT